MLQSLSNGEQDFQKVAINFPKVCPEYGTTCFKQYMHFIKKKIIVMTNKKKKISTIIFSKEVLSIVL